MPSRVIIFSGKGGTGKTTISAATASLLARQGRKVLVISSDPAHSLGDVVCQRIDRDSPTQLAPNLYALELDTFYEAHRSMSGLQDHMENAYKQQGVAAPVAAELAGQPGLDEILSLNRLREEAESGAWDVVIVDTAPTGNTLRLLAYPELLVGGKGVAGAMRAYKGISKILRSLKDEGATERYIREINRLLEIMSKLNRLLLSKDVTVRLVMNAEKLSLEETKRAYTFLSLYGISLDSVIVNKVYPSEAHQMAYILGLNGSTEPHLPGTQLGPYFNKWVALQQRYLLDIENSFTPLPILKAYLQKSEPLGVEGLADLAVKVYGLVEPAARLSQQRMIWVEDRAGAAAKNKKSAKSPVLRDLCLRIPFVEDSAQSIEVSRDAGELVINFGRIQRKVSLPRILNDAEFQGGAYESGVLRLSFGESIAPPPPVSPVAPTAPAKPKPALAAAYSYDDDPFSVN